MGLGYEEEEEEEQKKKKKKNNKEKKKRVRRRRGKKEEESYCKEQNLAMLCCRDYCITSKTQTHAATLYEILFAVVAIQSSVALYLLQSFTRSIQ